MTFKYTVIRPFMREGDDEPNHHYRPWLEANIGQQEIDWQWRIMSVVENTLQFEFSRYEDAILFELVWK